MRLLITVVLIGSFSCPLFSQTIENEIKRFARCYSLFTRLPLPKNHLELDKIKSGEQNGAEACMNLLKGAQFEPTTSMSPQSGTLTPLGKTENYSILKSFHALHRSWFTQQPSPTPSRGNFLLFDGQEPALFYLRALLKPETRIDSVLTDAVSLYAIRDTHPMPEGALPKTWSSVAPYTDKVVLNLTGMIQVGALKGVRERTPEEHLTLTNYSTHTNYQVATSPANAVPIDVHANLGGGILGNQQFLTNSWGGGLNKQAYSDGAEHLPRRWAATIFKDIMCRDLPVLNGQDTLSEVEPSSSISFRKLNSCMNCHTTMDNMTDILKGYRKVGSNLYDTDLTFVAPNVTKDTLVASGIPRLAPDPEYHKKGSLGFLHYRNYKNEVVKKPITTLAGLGAAIAEEDDFYVCLTHRYISYLVGVQIPILATSEALMTNAEKARRYFMVQTALELKEHQNVMKTIEKIINSDIFLNP